MTPTVSVLVVWLVTVTKVMTARTLTAEATLHVEWSAGVAAAPSESITRTASIREEPARALGLHPVLVAILL